MHIEPNTLLGNRYHIHEQIGEGGMGRIFKATDQESSQTVAVKVLRQEVAIASLEDRLRFRQEARAMIQVQHTNVVRVLSVDDSDGTPYLVMQWVDGKPLSDLIHETLKPLSVREAVSISIQIAQALECAHTQGIIHRDIKPSNVLIHTLPNNEPRAILLDFGVAHLQNNVFDDLDKTVGTLVYMSPEQLQVLPHPVDHRSDLYSLGVLMYELLTTNLPVQKRGLFGLMAEHIKHRPKPPHTRAPHVPPQVSRVVHKLLSLEPKDRYQSARSLILDLQRWLDDPDTPFELALDDTTPSLEDSTILIGRDEQRSTLSHLWRQATHGQGAGIRITGPEGVGKSRLAHEILNTLSITSNGLLLTSTQYPASSTAPYQTFDDLIDTFLHRTNTLQDHAAFRSLRARLKEELGPLLSILPPSLPSTRALIVSNSSPPALDPERETERQIDAIARAILCLSTPKTPLAIILDDVQWANDTTRAVITRLLQLAEHYPCLIVSIETRNEPLPARTKTQRTGSFDLHLPVFSRDETFDFVCALLRTHEPPFSLCDHLFLSTQGNPLQIVDTLHAALHEQHLSPTPNGWVFSPPPLDSTPLTSHSHAARLAQRLHTLSPTAHALLQAAATLQRPSSLDQLLATAHITIDPNDALHTLSSLTSHHRLLHQSFDDTYTLRHKYIRDTLLADLPQEHLSTLHSNALRTLSKDPSTPPATLAFHAHACSDTQALLQYAPAAAQQASETYAHDQATHWFRTLLNSTPDTHPQRPFWHERLGYAFFLLGQYKDALQHTQDAPLPNDPPDSPRNLSLLRTQADILFAQGNIPQSAQTLEIILQRLNVTIAPPPTQPPSPDGPPPGLFPADSEDNLPPLDDTTRVELATCERLQFIYAFTDPARLMAITLHMANLSNRTQKNRWRAVTTMVMGYGLHMQAQLEPSQLYFDHAARIFTELQSPLDLAFRDYLHGFLLISSGKLQEAYDQYIQAGKVFRQHGEQWKRLSCYSTAALAASYTGNLETLYQAVASMREITEHTHSNQHVHWVQLWETTTAHISGRLEHPLDTDTLRTSAQALSDLGDHLSSILTFGRCAEIARHFNDTASALKDLDTAIEILENRQQFVAWTIPLYRERFELLLNHPTRAHEAKADLQTLAHWHKAFPLLHPTLTDAQASEAHAQGDLQRAIQLRQEAIDLYTPMQNFRRAWELELRQIEDLQTLGDPSFETRALALRDLCYSKASPLLALDAEHIAKGKPRNAARSQTPTATFQDSKANQRLRITPFPLSGNAGLDQTVAHDNPTAHNNPTIRPNNAPTAHTPPVPNDSTPLDFTSPTQPPHTSSAFQPILRDALQGVQAERAVLYQTQNPHNNPTTQPIAWLHLTPQQAFSPAMNFAASTSQNAALSSSPQILTNFGHDDHLDAFSSVAYDTLRTILVTPLPSISTPSSIYTLYLDRTIQQHPFNNDHLDIVQDLLQAYTPKRP